MINRIVSQLSRKVATEFIRRSTAIRIQPHTTLQLRSGIMIPLVKQINYPFATENQQSTTESVKFSKFVTNPSILNKLEEHGLTNMFPIQIQSFPILLNDGDLLASDRTGSGKTLAYTLPILQKFYRSGENPTKIKKPRFLIMSPTRQLAIQVTNQIKKFAPNYNVVTVYGGTSISEQIRAIEKGVAIIVATPGRLIDLMEKEAINLSELKAVCLDEADTMLQKGFKEDVERIMEEVETAAGKTQNLMFSATIPPWVSKIARNYLTNMQKINLIREEEQRTSRTVDHYAMMMNKTERHEAVIQLIQRFNPQNRTIIFTQTKAEANDFIKYFDRDEIVILHGDIAQSVRETNLAKFRKGEQKILIATDVAARGLDIPQVELIIQLSPPENPEPYIHRSGRTGRAGKEGVNITFFDQNSIDDLIQIEQVAKIKIKIINNNFNISLWKKEADHLIQEIANREEDSTDPFYQLFVDEILKKSSPEKALLYFLRHKLGKVPQMTSVITNHKGYITYIAEKTDPSSKATIKETFKNFKIFNLTESNAESKFDILWNDYYHFEQHIEKQNDFQLEILDENNQSTLKQIKMKMKNRVQNKYQKSYSNSSEERRDRYNRDNRYGSDDRDYRSSRNSQLSSKKKNYNEEDKVLSSKPLFRDEKSTRYHQREVSQQLTTNIYLPRLPTDASKEEIQQQLKIQSGVDSFDLKIIHKASEDGSSFSFGFLKLSDPNDSKFFLGNQFKIKDFRVNPKVSSK